MLKVFVTIQIYLNKTRKHKMNSNEWSHLIFKGVFCYLHYVFKLKKFLKQIFRNFNLLFFGLDISNAWHLFIKGFFQEENFYHSTNICYVKDTVSIRNGKNNIHTKFQVLYFFQYYFLLNYCAFYIIHLNHI